jgi:hypothetical protein
MASLATTYSAKAPPTKVTSWPTGIELDPGPVATTAPAPSAPRANQGRPRFRAKLQKNGQPRRRVCRFWKSQATERRCAWKKDAGPGGGGCPAGNGGSRIFASSPERLASSVDACIPHFHQHLALLQHWHGGLLYLSNFCKAAACPPCNEAAVGTWQRRRTGGKGLYSSSSSSTAQQHVLSLQMVQPFASSFILGCLYKSGACDQAS